MRFSERFIEYGAWILITCIIALGLTMRLQVISQTEVEHPVRADAEKYVLYAYNLNHFNVYTHNDAGIHGHPEQLKPDALVTPGYPLFLSLFVGNDFTQDQYYAVLFNQAILSTLTILLSYLLFLRLGKGWALFTSLLVACSPHLINMSTYLLTETLFCFLLILFLMLCSRLKDNASPWIFFAAGLALGLATLTRPWTQGFVFLLLPFLSLTLTQQRLLKPLIIFSGFACVVLPWMIRNYWALGAVTDTTLSFTSVYHGMYPDMMYNFMPESLGFPYSFDPWGKNMRLSSQLVLNELYRRASENPWIYFKWYAWGKISTVFSWSILAGVGDIFVYPVLKSPFKEPNYLFLIHGIMKFTHIIWVTLSLMATVFVWTPFAKTMWTKELLFITRLLSLLMFYFMILHTIGAPFPRYSIPMRPVIYGLAMVMLAGVWNTLKQRVTTQ